LANLRKLSLEIWRPPKTPNQRDYKKASSNFEETSYNTLSKRTNFPCYPQQRISFPFYGASSGDDHVYRPDHHDVPATFSYDCPSSLWPTNPVAPPSTNL